MTTLASLRWRFIRRWRHESITASASLDRNHMLNVLQTEDRVVCLLVGTRILSYSHLHQLRSDRTLVPSSSYTPILPSYFLSYWLLPPTATEGGNSGKFKCINVFQTEDGWCDDSRRRTKWDCKQYHHYMIPWIPSLSVYTVLQSTVPTIIIITVFIE
jgi:hypothetical protein